MIPSTKWSGLGWTKRVLWPLCVVIIIAADEFHISNNGKILNRASVQRLGGIRKTINPYVLGLERIGRESQGVGPPSPSTTTVACITKCFGVQQPVQRRRTIKHRAQKKLRDLHSSPLQNHYIPATHLWGPCLCYLHSHQKDIVRTLKLEVSGEKHLLPPLPLTWMKHSKKVTKKLFSLIELYGQNLQKHEAFSRLLQEWFLVWKPEIKILVD